LLQVKSNQPPLLQEFEGSFPKAQKGYTVSREEDLGHGCIEKCQMKSLVLSPGMLNNSYVLKDWEGIKSIYQLTRKRCDMRTGKERTDILVHMRIASVSSMEFGIIAD